MIASKRAPLTFTNVSSGSEHAQIATKGAGITGSGGGGTPSVAAFDDAANAGSSVADDDAAANAGSSTSNAGSNVVVADDDAVANDCKLPHRC